MIYVNLKLLKKTNLHFNHILQRIENFTHQFEFFKKYL